MLEIIKLLNRYEIEMDIVPLRFGKIEDLAIQLHKGDYHFAYVISEFDLDRTYIDNTIFDDAIKSCIERFVEHVRKEECKE